MTIMCHDSTLVHIQQDKILLSTLQWCTGCSDAFLSTLCWRCSDRWICTHILWKSLPVVLNNFFLPMDPFRSLFHLCGPYSIFIIKYVFRNCIKKCWNTLCVVERQWVLDWVGPSVLSPLQGQGLNLFSQLVVMWSSWIWAGNHIDSMSLLCHIVSTWHGGG